MPSIIDIVSFTLTSAFFLGFGWYMQHAVRLWSTPEYGGPTYLAMCVKAMTFGAFLLAATFLANYFEIPKPKRDLGMLLSTPFALIGWMLSATLHRRRQTAGDRTDVESR